MISTIEKRALYNLLRMHWEADPSIEVESWQVEDYRSLPLNTLFKRLHQFSISLDENSFKFFAESSDSPEDLMDHLTGDNHIDAKNEDQIYLLLFEIWRRNINFKPSLSIFCDELDHLIDLNDKGQLEDQNQLQVAVAELISILNENIDAGIEPQEALKRIENYCANDLETFFYDYISDQIDQNNESYAQEILDGLSVYCKDNKWFEMLQAKAVSLSNESMANRLLAKIVENYVEEGDFEFNLELLSIISKRGTPRLFHLLVNATVPLLKNEEDFQDLLTICLDYFHYLDQEREETEVQELIDKRMDYPLDTVLNQKDLDVYNLLEMFNRGIA